MEKPIVTKSTKNEKVMLFNFIRLFYVSSVGTLGTFLVFIMNPRPETITIFTFYVNVISGFVGVAAGVLTCVFVYWQIKKIRMDLKDRKNKKKPPTYTEVE